MSSHTRGPRKRSRKPRPASHGPATVGAGPGAGEPASGGRGVEAQPAAPAGAPGRRSQAAERRGRRSEPMPVQRTFGARPQAPWHPLPLSEVLILAGAVSAAIGLRRGFHGGPSLLLAGLGAMVLGTLEVTLREHRSGYRSHTLMLSFLPVVVLHSVIAVTVAALTSAPRIINVALLALDVGLFLVLFRLWRARFLDARALAAARR